MHHSVDEENYNSLSPQMEDTKVYNMVNISGTFSILTGSPHHPSVDEHRLGIRKG